MEKEKCNGEPCICEPMTKKEKWENDLAKIILEECKWCEADYLVPFIKTLLAKKDKEMLDIRQFVVDYDEEYINEEVRMAINRMKKQIADEIDNQRLINK